eukprot:NODE_2866_length_1101_cov_37.535171_g2628_i0.p1 GENE.NODE_2866_length_1101_cov_37.535171_g2628_i0~~NODE_2866_length_1101_cov_37.535171_g2628_i0.p1  ORF type:complete len:315 (+),score=64.19 NODE_2866_length_1101_cov_37.535171_g2628_i0:74-946(+)
MGLEQGCTGNPRERFAAMLHGAIESPAAEWALRGNNVRLCRSLTAHLGKFFGMIRLFVQRKAVRDWRTWSDNCQEGDKLQRDALTKEIQKSSGSVQEKVSDTVRRPSSTQANSERRRSLLMHSVQSGRARGQATSYDPLTEQKGLQAQLPVSIAIRGQDPVTGDVLSPGCFHNHLPSALTVQLPPSEAEAVEEEVFENLLIHGTGVIGNGVNAVENARSSRGFKVPPTITRTVPTILPVHSPENIPSGCKAPPRLSQNERAQRLSGGAATMKLPDDICLTAQNELDWRTW